MTAKRMGSMLAVLVLASCGAISRDFSTTKTVTVNLGEGAALCHLEQLTYDLSKEQAFNDLKGLISTLDLKKITVRVKEPKLSDTSVAKTVGGTLKVSSLADASDQVVLGTYASMPLVVGESVEVVLDEAASKKLEDLALGSASTFYIEAAGCVDAVPANFSLEMELEFMGAI